jgi:hypothetical protein
MKTLFFIVVALGILLVLYTLIDFIKEINYSLKKDRLPKQTIKHNKVKPFTLLIKKEGDKYVRQLIRTYDFENLRGYGIFELRKPIGKASARNKGGSPNISSRTESSTIFSDSNQYDSSELCFV